MKWWQFRKRWRCPHVNVQGIYGDQINYAGGARLWCADCKRLLDGPVSIATYRWQERIMEYWQEKHHNQTP